MSGISKYGVMIGGNNLDLDRLSIYNFFVYYFGNPRMKRFKEIDNVVMYACRIPTQMTVNAKYIIVSVLKQSASSESELLLSQIDWISLQTRILPEKLAVPLHKYTDQPTDKRVIAPIHIFEKQDTIYKYKCTELPRLIISILFSPHQTKVYADTGNLKIAIETYNTVFTINSN